MKQEFDIPKTWFQLSSISRHITFIQARIVISGSVDTYEIWLAERLSHISLLLGHIFILGSLENLKLFGKYGVMEVFYLNRNL